MFNFSPEKRKRDGRYPPDLEERVENFFAQFKCGESIVFFYLNYDNPVSSEEYRYALVGCAKISEIGKFNDFKWDEQEYKRFLKKRKSELPQS